jgi:hypothetical protein
VQHQSAATRPHLTDRIQPLPPSTKSPKTFSDRRAATSYGPDDLAAGLAEPRSNLDSATTHLVLAPMRKMWRTRTVYRAALIRRRRYRSDAAPITRPAIWPSGEITSVLGKAETGMIRLNSAAIWSPGSLRFG